MSKVRECVMAEAGKIVEMNLDGLKKMGKVAKKWKRKDTVKIVIKNLLMNFKDIAVHIPVIEN